jgi:hypothetical protein
VVTWLNRKRSGWNTHVARRWKQGSKKDKPLGRPTVRWEYNRHETWLKVRIGFTYNDGEVGRAVVNKVMKFSGSIKCEGLLD